MTLKIYLGPTIFVQKFVDSTPGLIHLNHVHKHDEGAVTVGTQCGRRTSVATTNLSCGGRGCSRQNRFENVKHVSVSGLYLEQESPTAIARVSSSNHDLNTLPARLSAVISRRQPS